jgi:hypothetical protein
MNLVEVVESSGYALSMPSRRGSLNIRIISRDRSSPDDSATRAL